MGHFGPKRAILAPFGGPGRTLQKARVWPILGAIPMVPFWPKKGHGLFGSKRLKKEHFGSKRALLGSRRVEW